MTVAGAEQTAITEVVQAYIDGSRSGDADQLRGAFHLMPGCTGALPASGSTFQSRSSSRSRAVSRRMTRSRLVRAVIELMREHRQLTHMPTKAQVRAMAGFEGRAPSTYRLDPAVNWLPRCLAGRLPARHQRAAHHAR